MSTAFGLSGFPSSMNSGFSPKTTSTAQTSLPNNTYSTEPPTPHHPTFEQLDPNTKKAVEDIQKMLCNERFINEEISERITEPIDRIAEESQLLSEKLQTVLGTIQQDNQRAISLKKEYSTLLRNSDVLLHVVERALATGAAMDTMKASWNNYQLPSKYFQNLIEKFEIRMLEYRQLIETIQMFVETNSSIKIYTPSMIRETMQAQMEYFMAITSQVASLHESMQELQEQITNLYPERHDIRELFIDPYAPKSTSERTIANRSGLVHQTMPSIDTFASDPTPASTNWSGFGAAGQNFDPTKISTGGLTATPKLGFGSPTITQPSTMGQFGTIPISTLPSSTGFTTQGFGSGMVGPTKTGFGTGTTAPGFSSGANTTGFGTGTTTPGFGTGTTTSAFAKPPGTIVSGFGNNAPKQPMFGGLRS